MPFFVLCAFGQHNQAEQALNNKDYDKAIVEATLALEQTTDFKEKGKLLLALAEANRHQENYTDALAKAVRAITYFERVGYEVGKADAYIEIGLLYQHWQTFDKAIENFEKARAIYQQANLNRQATEAKRKIAHAQFEAGEYEKAQQSYEELLVEDRKVGRDKFLSFSLGKLAIVSAVKNPRRALDFALEKYEMEKNGTDYRQIAYTANSIGYLYRQLGEGEKAVPYFEKAIQALEKIHQKDELVWNNLGVTYTTLKKYQKAKESFEEALALNKAKNNMVGLAESYNYLAANEYLATYTTEARVYLDKAIEIGEQNDLDKQLAESYQLLAKIWEYEGDFKRSQDAFKKFKKFEDKLKSQIDSEKERLDAQRKEAERLEAELVQRENQNEQERLRLEKIQADAQAKAKENEILKKENELKAERIEKQRLEKERAQAAQREAQQALIIARQTLEAQQKEAELQKLEAEKNKQEAILKAQQLRAMEEKAAKERLEKDNQLKKLEADKQRKSKYIAYLIAIGAILLLLVAVFAFYQNQKKNKKIAAQNAVLEKQQKEIIQKNEELQASEEELRQNTEELQATNEQLLLTKQRIEEKNLALAVSLARLEEQKNIIEKKNHDITSSINYAQRIQSAMLPSLDKIKAALPDSFVFFQPRDIVSGDFYWFSAIDEDKCVIAAVDCTGHGVPGAFMSLIGNDALNEIINARKVYEADRILHDLHLSVVTALNQRVTDNRDGMDMALCVIDRKNKQLDFAGAKNELIYIQDNKVFQLKGDKMPIGGERLDIERFFAKQTLHLDRPTTCYIFSDGFQDQFGGKKGRKYMKKRLREFLLEIHQQPLDEQQKILKHEIETWMNGAGENTYSQIDDILIIGFRVG